MNKVIYLVAIAIVIFLLPSAYAANKKVKTPVAQEDTTVNPEYLEEIARIENYLNEIKNLVTDFTQVAPDGSTSSGTFFLSRPGKLRLQYNPPVPILIIVNGSLLVYYDYELNQVNHSAAKDSLASFLTRPKISLTSDIIITNLSRSAKAIRVTLAKKGKTDEGSLVMVFSEAPFELKKMEIVDAGGMVISVSFNDTRQDVTLDKKLFRIQEMNLRR